MSDETINVPQLDTFLFLIYLFICSSVIPEISVLFFILPFQMLVSAHANINEQVTLIQLFGIYFRCPESKAVILCQNL